MSSTERYYLKRLRVELEARIRKNPRYSLRSFARSMEVDAAALSRILSGRKVPTPEISRKVFAHIPLSPAEKSAFLRSMAVAYDELGVQRKRKEIREMLKKPRTRIKERDLTPDAFRVVADWHHYAILQLLEAEGARSEVRWIARELGIMEMEARFAIQRMQELDLIREENGRWIRTAERLTMGDPSLSSAAHKKRFLQAAEKSIHSMQNDPISERNHTSMTFAIDPEKIPLAKEMIQEFMDELAHCLQTRKKKVYELQVNLFPPSEVQMKAKHSAIVFLSCVSSILGAHPVLAQEPQQPQLPILSPKELVARGGDKGHAGYLENEGKIRLFLKENLKTELRRTIEWIDHTVGLRVDLAPEDVAFQWEVQRLVRNGVIRDILRSPYVIAEDDPTCREKMDEGQVAIALPGDSGGKICWSVSAILKTAEKVRTPENLVALAFHEHFHHFEKRSGRCLDLHHEKQAKFEKLHLARLKDEAARGKGFVYLIVDSWESFGVELGLMAQLEEKYRQLGHQVIRKPEREFRRFEDTLVLEEVDVVLKAFANPLDGHCYVRLTESRKNQSVITLKEEDRKCARALTRIMSRYAHQKNWKQSE